MGKLTTCLRAYLDSSRRERDELEKFSSELDEVLAEHDLNMDIICLDLNQHKEALVETLKEGQAKDATIAMQSNALAVALAEIRKLEAEIAETKRGNTLLPLDIEKANGFIQKKRKLN